MLCLLDDAAARAEARRLGLSVAGTFGVILRAKVSGRIARADPVAQATLAAGLYLDEDVLRRALMQIGESWPPA